LSWHPALISPARQQAAASESLSLLPAGDFTEARYAHIYCSHSERIKSIGASAHLNTTFKRQNKQKTNDSSGSSLRTAAAFPHNRTRVME